jgi:biopolymer transport protein ExbB
MWEFIKAGGWLMLPLLLCSIAALAIVLERWVRLRRRVVIPSNLSEQTLLKLRSGQLTAEDRLALKDSSLGYIFLTAYQYRHQPPEFVKAQMQAEATMQISALEKNINFLGTIGSIAPLLGLLGTVLGIIEAFLAVNAGGVSDPAMLASGVSKALITTAAGMMVAIPALVFYRYFQRLIVEYVAEMEQQATIFHAALFYDKAALD